jgi:pimeloyl-[acyl-carrier protein] methyl ester esterase
MILLGTLGKAFGTFGAFIAGDEDLVEYLIQRARPYIYTTALPPAVAEATRASLRIVQEEGWRREVLNARIAQFRAGAAQLGLKLLDSPTPIQALILGEAQAAMAASDALRTRGILVAAIRPPTVPAGSARLRITFSAQHSAQQVERLLEALATLPPVLRSPPNREHPDTPRVLLPPGEGQDEGRSCSVFPHPNPLSKGEGEKRRSLFGDRIRTGRVCMMLWHERQGSGPDLLLVHGWGLHGGIWGDLPARLAEHFRVTTLDLPGHGRSGTDGGALSLSAFTDSVAALCPAPAIWLGWSLGGLIALHAALHYPHKVAKLVLVGTTPKFVQAPDWPHAMPTEVFAGFARSLTQDYRVTLLRFLSLHAGNNASARALLKQLRADMFAHGEPQPEALAAGLAILEQTDLRARLAEIHVPALVVHGSHDRLAPPAAGEYLAAQLPDARLLRVEGAGHAPFLSHATLFADAVCAAAPGVPGNGPLCCPTSSSPGVVSPAIPACPGATEAT